jgi:hypothetical protein
MRSEITHEYDFNNYQSPYKNQYQTPIIHRIDNEVEENYKT